MERPIKACVVHIWPALNDDFRRFFHLGSVIMLFLNLVKLAVLLPLRMLVLLLRVSFGIHFPFETTHFMP